MGEYLKNCNCVATCPCDTVGVPAPNKHGGGVLGMRITEGNLNEVKLGGLKGGTVFHWSGALHAGNGTLDVVVENCCY